MVGKEYEYKAMADCERELWWYRNLHHLTLQSIKKYCSSVNAVILDAGCGTGGMLNVLRANGYNNIEGFDLSSDAIHYAQSNYRFNVKLLNILDSGKMYAPQSFDCIISNDVLCLLNDEQEKKALENLISLLKPGGYLFMNLPAGKAFKGTHDLAVGILRRYSPATITHLASKQLHISEYLFWPFLLSPVIFGVRFFQRLKLLLGSGNNLVSDVSLPSPFINKALDSITHWENNTFKKKPWGSSIFVVMQRSIH